MKIIAGAQALLDLSFDLQGCFEEYLSDEYKTFLRILRVAESCFPELPGPCARCRVLE